MKLTPWFKASKALPSRAGYYLVRRTRDQNTFAWRFMYWSPKAPKDNGKPLFWFHHNGPDVGANFNCCAATGMDWRGVAR